MKFKKTLVGLLALSLAGAFPLKTYESLKKEPYTKKTIEFNKLILNRNDLIAYFVNKNEEMGIRDALRIAESSAYEEMWIYLPEKNRWYETGVQSKISKTKDKAVISSVRQDKRQLEEILSLNQDIKKINFYHIHPSRENLIKAIEQKVASSINLISPLNSRFSNVSKKYFPKMNFSPSEADIKSMIYKTINYDDFEITHKVISVGGISEYFLTPEGIEYYKNLTDSNLSEFLFNEEESIYFSEKKDQSFEIKDKYLVIRFTPH